MSELPPIPNPLTSARVIQIDVPFDVYSAQKVPRGHPAYVMGRSDLSDFDRCPHKWKSGVVEPDTRQTEWGSLFEQLVMYPENWADKYAICPETYRSDKGEEKPWTFAAKVCQQWRDQQAGKTVIKASVFTEAKKAALSLFAQPQMEQLVAHSAKQVFVMGEYTDSATSIIIPLKGLIDFVPDRKDEDFGQCLVDLKTASDAHADVWRREVTKWRLHWQAALYMDLWAKATGEDRVDFRHAICESEPPYECAKRILSQDFLTLGRLQYKAALARYAMVLKMQEQNGPDWPWPGYDTAEHGLVYDGWLITEPDAWAVKNA